jgi:hypothetical protein
MDYEKALQLKSAKYLKIAASEAEIHNADIEIVNELYRRYHEAAKAEREAQ